MTWATVLQRYQAQHERRNPRMGHLIKQRKFCGLQQCSRRYVIVSVPLLLRVVSAGDTRLPERSAKSLAANAALARHMYS